MSTSNATNNNAANATQTEGNAAMNEVNAQTGNATQTETVIENEVTKNTSWSAFQKVVDGIIKDFKADNQELEMIVAMVPVQDVLSIDNVKHLIKGDKLLYNPAKRKNASKDSVTKPTTANQQRGALLELLPHYADLVKQNAASIASNTALMTVKQNEIQKANGRALTDKQIVALFKKVTTETQVKNAGKSEAELKIDAIEKMFDRAIRNLYLLRRVSAVDVTLNVKQKTITYTGFSFTFPSDDGVTKTKLSSIQGIYTKTLAELRHDSKQMLKCDNITAIRGNGKGASTKKAVDTAAPLALNPVESIADNGKEYNNMVRTLFADKNKEALATYKKAEAPKALFTSMVKALFIDNGNLDLVAFQKAINVAIAKAKIGKQIVVHYAADADTIAEKHNTKKSA